MLKAVVFDLDGTLLDTIPDIAGALNRALATCSYPVHPVERCKSFVGGGILEAIRRALPVQAGEEAVERVHCAYQADYPNRCTEQTDYYPGIREMLVALADRGILLGILSNKTETTTQKIVAHYFKDTSFLCVCGRVANRPLKPDPAAAAPVLAALDVKPEEIAFVGDSGTDMAFASAAGMLPVGVAWGYRDQEDLRINGAQMIAENAQELLTLLLKQM